jgi:hypothetical protein
MLASLNQFQSGLLLYALQRLDRYILSGVRHGNFTGQGIVPKMPMTTGGSVMAPTGSFEPPDDLPAIHVCIIHNTIFMAKAKDAKWLLKSWQGERWRTHRFV